MTLDSQHWQAKLEKEKATLEADLAEVARVNPARPSDWETTPVPGEDDPEMHDEVADFLEDLEERQATEKQLEGRLHQVRAALDRLQTSTFGTCQVCGQAIETERLEINPAATTCKDHRDRA